MKKLKYTLIFLLIITIWIAADWYWPVKSSIRKFHANEVALLDTKMWRSYYAGERISMFLQFAHLLRSQYDAPFWRSYIIAYYGARAAFIFKKGSDYNDYSKALPYLRTFYVQVQRLVTEKLDVEEAAHSELKWWIVHRERNKYSYNDLEKALQKNASAIFGRPDTLFTRYAFFRTKAMELRDRRQLTGGLTQSDWDTIENDLRRSWGHLHMVVN